MTPVAARKMEARDDAAIEILGTCDLCGGSGPFWTLAAEDPRANRILQHIGIAAERYTTVLCPQCGWIFKPGKLSEAQIDRLYSAQGGERTFRAENPEPSLRAQELHGLLGQFIDITRTLRILDVGGGVGQVSMAFARNGHEVHIVDIGAGTPLHPAMQVHRCALADFHPGRLFDLVLMTHVLEHVWSPTEFLGLAKSLTRPGGYLYIEVPFELYTPIVKRKLGDPCHVGYFSLHILRRLLAKVALTAVFAERCLGRYNARRVMILRALASNSGEAGAAASTVLLPAWMRTMAEMFHPRQLVYALIHFVRVVIARRQKPSA
jgi:2-polyprenyl-3-methyl-5-hydroxy-6-metoxy-1,4-benzoquinol methylase